ncbi:MAG: hypothetical protein A2Y24_01545 [Clostridiales bacterium GWE2_32_10]|nr:MAG: hypothetical protein A2Y24_01545 [Clostridiales bacterium GWE2_32_10]HBY21438.1 hypothetical protein [Clostridiales bacterium]
MDIKGFYLKNKYNINQAITIILLLIALIPMYFAYNYYNNYEDNILSQKKEVNDSIKKIKETIKKDEGNIKVKQRDLDIAKSEKKRIAELLDKYPQDNRQEAIANTNLYLISITQNIEVTKLDAKSDGIKEGEIEQIPFTLECKGSYIDIMTILNRINAKKFLYVKDINIRLDANMLLCSAEIITLAKKTEVVKSTNDQPTNSELIFVIRANPFGNTMSDGQKPIDNGTSEIPSAPNTPNIPNTQSTPNTPNTPNIPSNNDMNQSTNNQQEVVKKLYPLRIDAELIQDYNEKKNVIDDNTAISIHSISLKTPIGADVQAVAEGRIIFVGKFGTHGNSVMIEHKEGSISYYGNLSVLKVVKGQSIKKGQVIGYTGGVGDLKVPHLKFGYAIDGKFVDPKQYMNIQ